MSVDFVRFLPLDAAESKEHPTLEILSPTTVEPIPPMSPSFVPPPPPEDSPSVEPPSKRASLVAAMSATTASLSMSTTESGSRSSAGAAEDDRMLQIRELVETEREYVEDLNKMLLAYVNPILKKEMAIVSNHMVAIFLSTIQRLTGLHESFFKDMSTLYATFKDRPEVGNDAALAFAELFIRYSGLFALYRQYVRFYDIAVATLLVTDDEAVQNIISKSAESSFMKGQTFNSLTIKPVQRLPRYELFLKRMTASTPRENVKTSKLLHTAWRSLNQSLASVDEVAGEYSRVMKLMEIENKIGKAFDLMAADRYFLFEGPLLKGSKEVLRPVFVFLFSDGLMVTKKGLQKLKFLKFWSLKDGVLKDLPAKGKVDFRFEVKLENKTLRFVAGNAEIKEQWLIQLNQVLSGLAKKVLVKEERLQAFEKYAAQKEIASPSRGHRSRSVTGMVISCSSCQGVFKSDSVVICPECAKACCAKCGDKSSLLGTMTKKKGSLSLSQKCKFCNKTIPFGKPSTASPPIRRKVDLKVSVDDDDELTPGTTLEIDDEKDAALEKRGSLVLETSMIKRTSGGSTSLASIGPKKLSSASISSDSKRSSIASFTSGPSSRRSSLLTSPSEMTVLSEDTKEYEFGIDTDISRELISKLPFFVEMRSVLSELVISESLYLKDLYSLLHTFLRPMFHDMVTYYHRVAEKAKKGTSQVFKTKVRKSSKASEVVIASMPSTVACFINSLEEIYTVNTELFQELTELLESWSSLKVQETLDVICKIFMKFGPLLKTYSVYSSFNEIVRLEFGKSEVKKLFEDYASGISVKFSGVPETVRDINMSIQVLLLSPLYRISAYEEFLTSIKSLFHESKGLQPLVVAQLNNAETAVLKARHLVTYATAERGRVMKLKELESKFVNTSLKLVESGFYVQGTGSSPSSAAASTKRTLLRSLTAIKIGEKRRRKAYEFTLLSDLFIYSENTSKGLKMCRQFPLTSIHLEDVTADNIEEYGLKPGEVGRALYLRSSVKDFAMVFETPEQKDFFLEDAVKAANQFHHQILYEVDWRSLLDSDCPTPSQCQACKAPFSAFVMRYRCLCCGIYTCKSCCIEPESEVTAVLHEKMDFKTKSSLRALRRQADKEFKACNSCWADLKAKATKT